ncbi:MAG: hypothetical protein J5449_10790 [Oscillospiraceae bacterium]|nr:hypothetical protein [Oscillospiraceae bacterium]
MDEQELNELRKYKSTKEFAKAHKAKETIEEEAASGSLLASIIKSGVEYAAESIKDQLEDELDPLGLRWYFPSEEAKANGRRLERLEQLDAKRPEIKDYLKFDVMPRDKANGLHKKGLFMGAWNGFVDEIEAGRMGIAEVAVLAYDNITWSDDKEDYYLKIAALDGHVLKGGIRKIYYSLLAGADREKLVSPWLEPEDYKKTYSGRSEEEYRLYEAVFRANAYADVVDVSDKLHAYVLHFNRKNKDYYGVIMQEDYDDLKRIMDYVTFMTPENAFKPENNHTPEFDW